MNVVIPPDIAAVLATHGGHSIEIVVLGGRSVSLVCNDCEATVAWGEPQ